MSTRFSRGAVAVALGISTAAVALPSASADKPAASRRRPSQECVVTTLTFSPGLAADLEASVAPELVKDYGGGKYRHVVIPRAFDMVLAPKSPYDSAQTIEGIDVRAELTPDGARATGRLLAVIEAYPGPTPSSTFPMGTRRYAVAKALFESLARATQSVEHHVAQPDTYDQSFDKTTRVSPGGRITCTATTLAGQQDPRPTYRCSFVGMSEAFTQVYDSADANGICPTR